MNWKPIETAPKDGRLILVMAEDWDVPDFHYWGHNPRLKDSEEDRAYWMHHVEMDHYPWDEQPTHWFDLPVWPYNDARRGINDV